jgi:hypothetical protein
MGMRPRFSAAAIAALMLSGCATTHHFEAVEPVREGVMTPAGVVSFGGGASKKADIPCPGGMADVFVKQSFLSSLLSTLTLGAYQKTRIEFMCAKPASPDTPEYGGTEPAPEGASGRGG